MAIEVSSLSRFSKKALDFGIQILAELYALAGRRQQALAIVERA
jgi:hypothetical protein